jgi:hypothetical protein
MASTFNVNQSFFVTGINSILTQSAGNRSVSGYVTTSGGQNINLTSVILNYSTSGNSITITMSGYLNLSSSVTITSVTFSITYSYTNNVTATASSTVSGLSSTPQSGLYLVLLSITISPQQASVYI